MTSRSAAVVAAAAAAVSIGCLVTLAFVGGLPALGLAALLMCATVLGVRCAWGHGVGSIGVVATAASVNALVEAESEAYAEQQSADEAAEVVEQMAREAVNAEQAARGSDLALALAESGEPDQDPTTGLWSRRALERAMAAAVADDRWAYPGRVVMLVVLDDFNTIVAEHGREVGRDVFAAAAQRLTACLRPGDMAVRHGIDGFAVLLESNAVMNTARPVAERVIMAMAFPFMVADQFVAMGACVGLTVSNGDLTPDGLLLTGIGAASIAKRAGRGHIIQVT